MVCATFVGRLKIQKLLYAVYLLALGFKFQPRMAIENIRLNISLNLVFLRNCTALPHPSQSHYRISCHAKSRSNFTFTTSIIGYYRS